MTPARRPAEATAGSGGPIVLVVDDDAQVRRTIRLALESEGLEVAEAAGHRDALEAAAAGRLGLVVLDITLPGSDSTELAATLRAAHGEALPILVVTADGHAQEKGKRVGAYASLRKPFDLSDLLDAVRQGLTTKR